MVSLQIDGRKVQATPGMTVLEAANSIGVKIPTLCYFKGVEPYGACRLCTVEISVGGKTSFQASCCLPVKDGLIVRTKSPAVLKGRKLLLELLLARCSDNPKIRKFAAKWGVHESRFAPRDEDCILCGLCARMCSQYMGPEAIAFHGRGIWRKVGTPFGSASEVCVACGACTFVCPTGKIQMEAETTARLRKKVGTDRKCRYMLMGMVSSKLCPSNYNCRNCAFDQTMEYRFGTHPSFAFGRKKQKAL